PEAWLKVDIDLARITGLPGLAWKLPIDPPRVVLSLIGDGENVHTRAELEFPKPLPIELEPWNIPTNVIREPLIGFGALRGFKTWLEASKPWNELKLGEAPNQASFFAQKGLDPLHFVAMPSQDASNQVATLSDYVMKQVNPGVTSYHLGTFYAPPNRP